MNLGLSVLGRGTDQVPFVASDVEEHGDAAIRFHTRCPDEPHTGRCHPCVHGIEILHVEEETDPPGGLLPDDGGLVFSVGLARSKPVTAPGGRTVTHRLGRPSLVRDGESSASSNPSTSTKKLIAGSYSLTTMAMRPRCTRASMGDPGCHRLRGAPQAGVRRGHPDTPQSGMSVRG
jgi:hypothetical protein